jgi:hypothetical protein
MDSEVEATEKSPAEHIRERIEYALGIWPKLSKSMLQVGIGTSISPDMWHPVFDKMVEDGVIIVTDRPGVNPKGRKLTHEVIQLARQPDPGVSNN